jgi:large subunit ribosomal protein L15
MLRASLRHCSALSSANPAAAALKAGAGSSFASALLAPACSSTTPSGYRSFSSTTASHESADDQQTPSSPQSSTSVPLARRPAPVPSIDLQNLGPAAGSSKDRKRKGRGHASGMGKYATRGMKGAKSRAGGGVSPTFEGGQTPIHRRTPKMGYMPAFLDAPMEPVNLDKLQLWIDSGRIDPTKKITMKVMLDSGLVSDIRFGVKLLGRGSPLSPSSQNAAITGSGHGVFAARGLDIEVSQASGSAIKAIEELGGRITAVYYSSLALKAHLGTGRKHELPLKSPLPADPKLLRYYSDYEKRGYLSPEFQLATIKRRMAEGVPHAEAVQVLPVYIGGESIIVAMFIHGAMKASSTCSLLTSSPLFIPFFLILAGGPEEIAEKAGYAPARKATNEAAPLQ